MKKILCEKKGNLCLAYAVFLFCILLLSGCGGTELENKSFPLAVLVARQDGRCLVGFLSQNLSEVSNENADADNLTAASALGNTYYEAQKTFEKNNRCQLDLSHTKVIVFTKDFMENDSLELFLETVRRENTYARNTLVYLTDSSPDELAKLNGSLDAPLGTYLEQMMENERDLKEQAAVTLGALLNEQENRVRTLLLPVLRVQDGLPIVHAYAVMQDFRPKGTVSTEEAQISYLLAGQLLQLDLQPEEGVQVRLGKMKCRRDFRMESGRVVQQLTLTVEARQVTGAASEREIGRVLQEKTEAVCRVCMEEKQVDIADSYRYLAMRAPKIYRAYAGNAEKFRAALDYEVIVRVRIV